MIGMPTPGTASSPPPAPTPAARPGLGKTMLGVAIPGIAPTGESAAPAPPGPTATAERAPHPMLAPTPASPMMPPMAPAEKPHADRTAMLKVPYVPPPAPLEDEPAPSPPRLVRKRGVPLAVVGGVTAGVVLVFGIAMALLWRSAPPITAQPKSTPDGRDALHLVCDPASCKDGTVAALATGGSGLSASQAMPGAAHATFVGGEADLALPEPLRVGENTLPLVIDRPGMGRDETVKLVVPVAYRVRADVSTMESARPSITIRVEARPGTDVRVDGKPVSLDGSGTGSYAVDESAAAEGAADESRVVSVDVPYVVTPKGGASEKGVASARVAIAPLRVDAPGARSIVEEASAMIAGRAARGSTVTVDGSPVPVGPDGAFETTVALAALGDRTVEVRAGTPTLMPRTVHVVVTRVQSLADAAREFERQPSVGYDSAMSDITGKTGQSIVVTGDVLDARSSGHRTVVLVDDRRGCAKGPCLARVVLGRDMALTHGEVVSAYGVVARAVAAPGPAGQAAQMVPEVEAQFLVPRAPRR
jgi:hypothetical protein